MARIVLIDDDVSLLDVLGLAFEDAGHEVLTAADGQAGLERIERDRPDAVVSDVNMPKVDGFTLCRRVRERGDQVPLVLLTSRDDEVDEALGLELGADDYVTKPFSTRVLLARVGALLRRQQARQREPAKASVRTVGALTLDAERIEVAWSGQSVTVTVTEFRMLEALTDRPGIVLSRGAILERIRGDTAVAERIIDTYVRRLRRKLEALEPGFDRIETVVGAGYRWKTDG